MRTVGKMCVRWYVFHTLSVKKSILGVKKPLPKERSYFDFLLFVWFSEAVLDPVLTPPTLEILLVLLGDWVVLQELSELREGWWRELKGV